VGLATGAGPHLARDVARVLAIFPFEVGFYQEAGVPVEFVGHPVLDVLPALDRETARAGLAAEGETLVGLLPGSRDAEIRRHLPVLLGAAHRIAARRPRTRFALPVASTIAGAGVAAATRASGLPVEVLPGEAYRVMAAADLLLVSSGTATLEAACYGTPMIVLYRLSAVSRTARRLVAGVAHQPPNIGGREIVRAHQGRMRRRSRARSSSRTTRPGRPARGSSGRARLGSERTRAARAVLRERDGRPTLVPAAAATRERRRSGARWRPPTGDRPRKGMVRASPRASACGVSTRSVKPSGAAGAVICGVARADPPAARLRAAPPVHALTSRSGTARS
jgi:hypothetical protein